MLLRFPNLVSLGGVTEDDTNSTDDLIKNVTFWTRKTPYLNTFHSVVDTNLIHQSGHF